MRRYLVLLGVLAACHGMPARAEDERETRETCTWESAGAATVEQITVNFRGWQGKCVRVKALHAYGNYATTNRLLSDRTAVLEDEEPRQRSVVLNADPERGHERHRPRWEEVLGTVGSCQIANEVVGAMQAADPDEFIMIAGLCHYTLDHFLVPVAFRAVDAPAATRLRRSEVEPGQLKLLVVAPAASAYRERRETGERMFAALEGLDFKTFVSLDQPEVARDLATGGEASLHEADRERLAESRADFEEAVAAFGAAKIGRGKPIMLAERSLDEASDLEVLNGPDAEDGAYWCRLREGADEDDLPVLAEDIDNDPSRPFFCLWTGEYVVFRQGTVPSARVPLFADGFLEQAE